MSYVINELHILSLKTSLINGIIYDGSSVVKTSMANFTVK